MSGPGELKKLAWNEKSEKYELTFISRTESHVETPLLVLSDEGIKIGCMMISKAAWEKLGERYRAFIITGHREIVQ